MSLLKRLNKSVDSKECDNFNCTKNIVDMIAVGGVVRQEQKHTIKKVECSKEPKLVLVAALEAID